MDTEAVLAVLRDVRAKVAEPTNDFTWSSWEDQDAAVEEIDHLASEVAAGRLPWSLHTIFAPTGPLQEVALSSGWGDLFLALADRLDAAVEGRAPANVLQKSYCAANGWVVDGRPLPTDAADHDGSVRPALGCTNLTCVSCKKPVRTIAGFGPKQVVGSLGDFGDLYEELERSQLVQPCKGWRLYVCRCAYHLEAGESRLDDPEGIVVATQRLWSCDGHPVAELPRRFDGVLVDTENLESLARDVLRGGAPPGLAAAPPRDEERPETWLARLATRLAKTPQQRTLLDLVKSHLTDADPRTRGRAVRFFVGLPEHAAHMEAARLLRDHADLFVGVVNSWSNIAVTKTLDQLLWRSCATDLPNDAELREVAHAFAFDAWRSSRALFFAIALNEPAWLVENAAAILGSNPGAREHLLAAADAAMILRDMKQALGS